MGAGTLRDPATATPQISYKDLQAHFLKTPPTHPQEVRDVVMRVRAEKFPDWHVVGTAGSFFKNPIITVEHFLLLKKRYPDLPGFSIDEEHVKVPLGYILDKLLELRGVYKGNVGCFEGQALVAVTTSAATTVEVIAFASFVALEVKKATDIDIEWEVTRVGF